MTIRDLFEYASIEINNLEAPSLLIEDYNYFINKAVQQYINKVYNRYDVNQQSSDDLRVLKVTKQLPVTRTSIGKIGNKEKFSYHVKLPNDYVHILNCIVEFEVQKPFGCYSKGDHVQFAAKRLTTDMASGILNNYYMKPNYTRPYYYINNVDLNPVNNMDEQGQHSDNEYYNNTDGIIDSTVTSRTEHGDNKADTKKAKDVRAANASDVRIEIRFGNDDSIFKPIYVYIDYIKAPMFIRLTYADVTSVEDNTRLLEFPDYVCYEIVNEFVKLLMENSSDPRLQTNIPINQTIADPARTAK